MKNMGQIMYRKYVEKENNKLMENVKVKLTLVGIDKNTFSLMVAFRKAASRQGWDQADIDEVLYKCMSGDYNHLLSTLMDYTEDPE